MKRGNSPKKRATAALLERAIAIAVEAHQGQRDKSGRPYILHPLRVMSGMRTDQERIVAILHDVVEDSPWTFKALKKAGFPDRIVAAVDDVTRRKDEAYEAFVRRSAANPVSRRVKIADLEDNMDLRRLTKVTPKAAKRFKNYLRAWKQLTNGRA